MRAWRMLIFDCLSVSHIDHSPDFDKLESESATYYGKIYLNFGESVFDFSSAWLGSSDYFTRK